MPNGRSGAGHIHTTALIAALKRLDGGAVVGPSRGNPVTAAEMLVAAECTSCVSILVEEQYSAWFIVRLPELWVTVKEESPLFAGLVQGMKQYDSARETPSEFLQRPIENCYWVAPKKFLAGEYPGALNRDEAIKKIKALTGAGVAAFIDLTEEGDGLEPYADLVPPATYQRFGIRDVSTPDSPKQTLAILNTIDEHIKAGRLVYVHCWGGVGRTGVIVGCWLSRHGLENKAAVERLAELWKQCPKSAMRKSPETFTQVNYIQDWYEEPKERARRRT